MAATGTQVRALYDFSGEPSSGELTFYADEILDILRQDVGDGWWEARNASGESGLIPEAYVEVTSLPEPSMPPPPPPPSFQPPAAPVQTNDHWNNQGYDTGQDNGYQSVDNTYHTDNTAPLTQQPSTQSYSDEWDDDWDDDDSSTTTEQVSHSGNFDQVHSRESKHRDDAAKFGTVKKSFNRFSKFAKSGGEAFIMGQTTGRVSDNDVVKIIETTDGYMWEQNSSPYTCSIASPKKETKLKGLKSFIVYQLTPTFSGIQVSRRYKHFDWLHERLEEKFPCIVVPPLPDKQIAGRFEEDFIQDRMRQLQEWINRLIKHPVVSRSDVFLHFLSCTEEKQWKQGKRKAEKDDFQGGKYFLTVQCPPQALDSNDARGKLWRENQIDNFGRFSKTMEDCVKHLIHVTSDNMRKHMGPFKREFQKIGNSFTSLAQSFEMQDAPYSQNLTLAIKHTGKTYDDIGGLFEQQPKYDIIPLNDSLHEYKGILSCFPEILQMHKGAMVKVRECQKSQEEGKITESDAQGVTQRGDTVSYAVLAEINEFHHERVTDFKINMQNYLREQIEFYKKITRKLEETLAMYDNA